MKEINASLRASIGRALREIRHDSKLSLDEIERATQESGTRVTRSHLSRVENGQADLVLPRFLGLMRALGEPAEEIVTRLDALVALPDEEEGEASEAGEAREEEASAQGAAAADAPGAHEARAAREGPLACRARASLLCRRAGRHLERGEAHEAALCWRSAFALASGGIPAPDVLAWARAEARCGRYRIAARVLREALARARGEDPRLVLESATAHLGAGQPAIALALARGAAGARPREAELVEIAALLSWGRGEEALERALGPDKRSVAGLGERSEEALLGGLLAARAYAQTGRPRAALRAARAVLDAAPRRGLLWAEAALLVAEGEGRARQTASALRHLSRTGALARSLGVPELLFRTHATGEAIWRRAGDRGAAMQARRAARALARRLGAEASLEVLLPRAALSRLAARAED